MYGKAEKVAQCAQHNNTWERKLRSHVLYVLYELHTEPYHYSSY